MFTEIQGHHFKTTAVTRVAYRSQCNASHTTTHYVDIDAGGVTTSIKLGYEEDAKALIEASLILLGDE